MYNRDSVSLRRLLEELAESPTVVSRAWTRERYKEPLPGGHVYDPEMAHFLADKTYKKYADASGDYLDPMLIRPDLSKLSESTRAVVQYADRAIAHDDAGGVRLDSPLTFDGLDTAIFVLDELVRK